MNLLDNYFLILFVCGFLDSLLADIGKGNEKSKSENSNRKLQNIQKFCNSNFYDTNGFCGIGIISRKGGQKCIKWKDSNYNQNWRERDTTFCHKGQYDYYCATSYSSSYRHDWDYCRPIKCISATSDKTCQSNIHWSSTSSSIEIDYSRMPAENNFLIFAYIGPNGCLVSQLCRHCDSANYIVNQHFNACTLIQQIIKNEKVINIRNLSRDTKYTFYLIPVFNDSHIGHIAKLSLQTKKAAPNIPSNITIIDRTITKITIKWDPPQQTNIYGPAKEHLIEITSKIDTKRTYKTSINYYTFQNLEPCQNYCFIIKSMNDAGNSSRSESKCFSTKADLTEVILDEIGSYYSTSRPIKWRYDTTKGCPATFTVQYYNCNSERNSIIKTTSSHHIELDGLLVHEKYCVRVRPQMGNDVGTFSRISEFYTSEKTPKITNYTINGTVNQIDIYFEIDSSNALENSIYRFLLSNRQNECFYQVIFLCEDCPYKFIESHLNGSQLIEYQNIKNCSINEKKMFKKTDSKFVIKILKSNFHVNETNISLSIYAINPSGMHQIMKREFTYSHKPKSFSSYFNLLIISIIVLSIIIIAFIAIKKFKSSKLMRESSEIHNDVTIKKEPNNSIYMNSVRNSMENQSELVHELLKDKASILKEYKNLKEMSIQLEREMELTKKIASLPENTEKNRFHNILPYDQTRVLLKDSFFDSDYINANFISFENDPHKVEYIAAQGPNEASISDFWLMIWEQNISIIVMLTKTYENGNEKCIQYWPDQLNVFQYFGSEMLVSVSLEDETVTEMYIERKLSVKYETSNEIRSIIHLQMEAWPDYSVPKFADFESFLYRFRQFISSTNRQIEPYLIHCSAGVGRTGTFIVIDRIIRKMESGKRNINIQGEVLEIRQYRNSMVQRQAQYVFIYEFVRYFVDKHMEISDYGADADIYFNV